MTLVLRLVLAIAVTVACYWLLTIAFAFFPIFSPGPRNLVSAGCGLTLGVGATWAATPDSLIHLRDIFGTAIKWGAIGFALGFVGPMILAPGANQGPLLGFFIGPVAFVTGGIYAFFRALTGSAGDADIDTDTDGDAQ